jgi:putative ABC transport system permease protein
MGTLRVIGFTHAEVSFILLGELAILTLAAIPFGILFGMGFVWLSINSIDTETFRIPLYISRSTMAFSAGVTILASVISGMVVQRRLRRLELVAVLKQRE